MTSDAEAQPVHTHPRDVSRSDIYVENRWQPIFAAIEPIAVHCEACSPWCSNTIRTARSRTSGAYFVDAFFVMAPVSQELEPPANPARFIPRQAGSDFKLRHYPGGLVVDRG